MRYLEQFVTHLLNENEEKAFELLRKHIIDRAREIHESLRQEEDSVLSEGWDDEIMKEQYFSESDLDDAVIDDGSDIDADAAGDELEGDLDADSADMDADLGDMDADVADMDADVDGETGDLADEVADMKATLDRLVDELDAFINGDGDSASGDDDDSDDFGDMGDSGDGDEAVADDDYGQADDNYGDDDDAIKESEEEFDDITESIIDELEKVTVSNEDGRQQGNGKFTQNTKSLPSARDKKGEPIKMKRDDHKGFARETEPTSVARKKYRNNNPSADTGRKPVSKEGDASATLNKTKTNPSAQSLIGGK